MDKWWDGYGSAAADCLRGTRYDYGTDSTSGIEPTCTCCGTCERLLWVLGGIYGGDYVCHACVRLSLYNDRLEKA